MRKVTMKFILITLFFFTSNLYAQVPVLTQPENQTVLEGQTATFSVSVVGGLLPVTYKWQVTFDQNIANFSDIPGAVNSSYTTPPTTLSLNNSWYRCVVTNDSGSTISDYAILTVNPIVAPTITSQPSNQSIFVGEAATFNITATGTDPLSYQWHANSVEIPGANSTVYITDVIDDIAADGTIIYCVVSNAGGSVESNSVTLNVSYENVRITDGIQVLYNFKETTGSTVNDESGVGTALNLSINNPSDVNWTAKGLNVGKEIRIKSTTLASKITNACVASNEMSFEAWIIPSDMIQRGLFTRIMTMTNNDKNTSSIKLDQFGTDYGFHVRTTSTGLNGQTFTTSNNNQELIHYFATKDDLGNLKIYINGTKVLEQQLTGNFSNWDNGYFLYLGSDAENNTFWQGTFYLAAIYSKALSESEINQNYFYGVDYDTFPYITQNPVDVFLIPVGETATFSIKAIGNAPLSYQWYRNNSSISGANSPSYTTPALNLGNNNDTYKCIVTSSDGSKESSSATLTVSETNERITLDVIAQYTFTEGSGTTINDVSGVGDPLNLVIGNIEDVEWVEDGIEIVSAANISSSVAAAKIYSMCTTTNELTIETWIKPKNKTQNAPSRIVSYSKDVSERNFSFSQEADQYSCRLRSSNTTNNGFPFVISNDSPVESAPQHVVYVFRGDAVGIIFVNGVEVVRKTLGGDFSTWDSSFRFGIANEFVDSRPWLGTMNYLAIFNRRLTSEEVVHNYNVGPYDAESTINSPTELTALVTEVGKVNLSWVDNAINEDKFIIERNESDPVSWVQISSISSNSIMFVDSNVAEGKSYDYRVQAVNSFLGEGLAISNTVSAVTLLNNPTGLVGRSDELGKITLNWLDNSSAETGFSIERGLASGDPVIYTAVGSVATNITTYDDFSVEEGVVYSYRIKAFNVEASSNASNVLKIRSKASFVNAPSNLNISIHPLYTVPVLTWIDNAFNETGFVVERRIVGIGTEFIVIETLASDITTFIDGTVSDSTSYIYRVHAFNDEYVSEPSAEVFIDVLVGVEEIQIIPEKFGLLQNYPNPFNPSTTFTFNLPVYSDVNLSVYNLLGQKILTIVDNNYSAGSHTISFDAHTLTSGIYVYVLSASSSSGDNFVQSKKFILLK